MYSRMLQKFPILTKMITSGALFSVGDCLTQKFIEKKEQFDWTRNRNLFITGAVYLAPCLHFWYGKFCPALVAKFTTQSTSAFGSAFTGMLFDQFLFAPIFLSGFFVVGGFLQTLDMEGLQKGFKTYKQKIFQTLMTNWKIWPAATMVNFMYVPMQYRVLFANFIGLFWNIYLSYITYR